MAMYTVKRRRWWFCGCLHRCLTFSKLVLPHIKWQSWKVGFWSFNGRVVALRTGNYLDGWWWWLGGGDDDGHSNNEKAAYFLLENLWMTEWVTWDEGRRRGKEMWGQADGCCEGRSKEIIIKVRKWKGRRTGKFLGLIRNDYEERSWVDCSSVCYVTLLYVKPYVSKGEAGICC